MRVHRLVFVAAIACLMSCEALPVNLTDLETLSDATEPDALARKGKVRPPLLANTPIPNRKQIKLPSPSPTSTATPTPEPSPAVMSRVCEQLTCLTEERVGSQFLIYIQPGVHADLTVKLAWTLDGMVADQKAPDPVVLKAGAKTLVGKLRFTGSAGGTYNVQAPAVRYGDMSVTSDAYVYGLPWRAGETYTCGNGWNGFGAHQGDYGHAVDFLMPEGTPVLASRDGVVFATENRYSQGGNDPALGDKANYVYIRHDNGTYGRYLHFRQGGVEVQVGQPVRRGQLIGYSGNTGWSTDPHLHFDVMTAKSASADRTIGVKFQTQAGQSAGEVPTKGRSYTAF